MESNKMLPIAVNKQELLSEMESLLIFGGEGDGNGQEPIVGNNVAIVCKPNTYCKISYCAYCANCVAGCGTKPGATGESGDVAP